MNEDPKPADELSERDKKEINRDLLDAIVYGKDNSKKDKK